MDWYCYNWTSDLLPSKLKDKSTKIHVWKYKRLIQYEINYPYLKADSRRENYKCNTVLPCPCIWENISVGSQERLGLCSAGGVWGGFCFICVCLF